MNTALIFAGGTGSRMKNKDKPKQFLELNGKPIIIHTIEHFDEHPEIDAIVVVCLESWIDFLRNKLEKFNIKKVVNIVPGGMSGQESIRNGLFAIRDFVVGKEENPIVLIHDGVRPLINAKLISDNIQCVKKKGNAITVVPAIETIIETDDNGNIAKVADRTHCKMARAPQSFYLKDILSIHRKNKENGNITFIDSCSMMSYFGYKMATIEGPMENIKITTPTDYFIFRAMVEVHENQQIFGF